MKKKIRVGIVAALIIIGVLLVVGAIGNGDFYGYMTGSDFVHIVLGLAMTGAGVGIQAYAESGEM